MSFVISALTNHAINRAKEHWALGGCGALAEVLQHQRTMAEDIYKLPEVKQPHFLQVLTLLVCGGRTDRRKDGGREMQKVESEGLQTIKNKTCEKKSWCMSKQERKNKVQKQRENYVKGE